MAAVNRETVRWGIIGVGDVCEKKSGPGFQKANHSELSCVMRRTLTLAADFANRHGVPQAYATIEEVLDSPDIDAVYIATRPGTHLEIALKVAAARKPCYLEKPMARNLVESQEIVDAFAATSTPLFVAYYRRGLERCLKAAEIVKSGKLGRITDVTYRFTSGRHTHKFNDGIENDWRLQPVHSGGGLFMDVGCHALDLLDFLLGPLSKVQGRAIKTSPDVNANVEDVVSLTASVHPNGAGTEACLTASWNFASGEGSQPDWITITGTRGVMRLTACNTTEDVRLNIVGEKDETFSFATPPHIQQPMIQTVVDDLRGGAHCTSTPSSALRTAVILDTVLSDFYGDRSQNFWEQKTE